MQKTKMSFIAFLDENIRDIVVAINKPVHCQTKNAIYCISCSKCDQQYIGETDRSLQARFSEHKGYVLNKYLNKARGRHFNQPGHRISDMQATTIEKVIKIFKIYN